MALLKGLLRTPKHLLRKANRVDLKKGRFYIKSLLSGGYANG